LLGVVVTKVQDPALGQSLLQRVIDLAL